MVRAAAAQLSPVLFSRSGTIEKICTLIAKAAADGVADDAKFAGSWQIKKFEAAAWFRENVSPANPNYRVVAYSAGATAFSLFDHVINLDGLANDSAGESIMSSHSVAGYVERIKPDYIIEVCHAETEYDNLERLHLVPFPQQGDYCIDRFIYEKGTPQ